jgi:uncharacterized protein (TIGR03437 family)
MLTGKLTSIAVAMALTTALPAANLLVNGSFEQGPNPGSYTNFAKGSTGITGWTVSLGNIDYIGSLWTAADGSRSLDLEGSSGTCDLSTPNCPGGIAQSFATVAGQEYMVTFSLAGNLFNIPVVKTIRVSAAGQFQTFAFNTTGHSAANMGWVTINWTFTATAATTTLEFDTADNPPTGWGPALDNVSVNPVSGIGPGISNNGVVNGASFASGVVPNSWATIQGFNLSTVTGDWSNSIVNGMFPVALDGLSVSVGSAPAYLYYVSPGQINLLVPPNIGPGTVPVTVTNSVGTSTTFTVTASTYGPAFFLWPNNQAVATRQDFSLAAKNGTFSGATTVAAKPGDVIILWGTGFGPTSPAAPPGVAVPSSATFATATLPTVTINKVPATVYGAALAPGFAGLYQVAIQVPSSLGNGDWPVVATIGGVASPAGVILTVQQ